MSQQTHELVIKMLKNSVGFLGTVSLKMKDRLSSLLCICVLMSSPLHSATMACLVSPACSFIKIPSHATLKTINEPMRSERAAEMGAGQGPTYHLPE